MERGAAAPVTIDIAAFIADPWSRGGLTVVDDLTRAGHVGELIRVTGHAAPAALDAAVHDLVPADVGALDIGTEVDEWAHHIGHLGRWLMRAFALGLGQPIGCFELATSPDLDRTVIHLHHDGPRGLFATAGGDRGHQDADLLTIVHLDQSGMLEIAHGAHWEPVDAVTGCYVVLLGTDLERISHGYLRASMHRVREMLPGHGHHVVACRLWTRAGITIDPVRLPPPLERRAAGPHQVTDQA